MQQVIFIVLLRSYLFGVGFSSTSRKRAQTIGQEVTRRIRRLGRREILSGSNM
jgi:hypothetical protein